MADDPETQKARLRVQELCGLLRRSNGLTRSFSDLFSYDDATLVNAMMKALLPNGKRLLATSPHTLQTPESVIPGGEPRVQPLGTQTITRDGSVYLIVPVDVERPEVFALYAGCTNQLESRLTDHHFHVSEHLDDSSTHLYAVCRRFNDMRPQMVTIASNINAVDGLKELLESIFILHLGTVQGVHKRHQRSLEVAASIVDVETLPYIGCNRMISVFGSLKSMSTNTIECRHTECALDIDVNFYVEHLRIEHDNIGPPVECPHCGKGYRLDQRNALQLHIKTHSPYECPDPACDLTFTNAQTRDRHHTMAHTDDGVFCTICNRRFADDVLRERHEVNHVAKPDRPLKCPEESCFAAFVLESDLKKHIAADHNASATCQTCGQGCRNQKKLQYHLSLPTTCENRWRKVQRGEKTAKDDNWCLSYPGCRYYGHSSKHEDCHRRCKHCKRSFPDVISRMTVESERKSFRAVLKAHEAQCRHKDDPLPDPRIPPLHIITSGNIGVDIPHRIKHLFFGTTEFQSAMIKLRGHGPPASLMTDVELLNGNWPHLIAPISPPVADNLTYAEFVHPAVALAAPKAGKPPNASADAEQDMTVKRPPLGPLSPNAKAEAQKRFNSLFAQGEPAKKKRRRATDAPSNKKQLTLFDSFSKGSK